MWKKLLTWRSLVDLLLVVIAVMHFWNPIPIVQAPDMGHRLYFVPPWQHDFMVETFRMEGFVPYGTFLAGGIRQTLFRDGITVIASGPGIRKAAISLVSSDPQRSARNMQASLAKIGVQAEMSEPPEPEYKGKLFILKLPQEIGWEVAFRAQGWLMPWPRWEK